MTAELTWRVDEIETILRAVQHDLKKKYGSHDSDALIEETIKTLKGEKTE